MDRRTFLKVAGAPAIAAALPGSIGKALAIPANSRTRSIADVEHVVFLMQENRSFDHYFGTLRGVRGFADPHPMALPSGKSVWHQPDEADDSDTGDGELLPFRPDVPDVGQTFLPDPPHGWNDGHAAWNGGRYDQWVPNKGVTAMTYHLRRDLPYQFALADAFTVCDNYHCSLIGPTDPNRYHMWSGWVGNDGRAGGPVVTNAELGYDWSTYPERLQRNGISWRVYQDVGVGLNQAGFWGWTDDPYIGNYGDNSLLYFHQYQDAPAGSPLAKGAKTGTEVRTEGRDPLALLSDFREDVRRGRLPQVSWIVAPEAYTEHPNWEPGFGAWYVSQVVDILASNPEVWSKMALFVTYDEEGGFFDHLVPPTPPSSRAEGLSTVPTTNEIYPGGPDHPGGPNQVAGPYGLGIRVPMIVVSPWTRGGWVDSQLFDHTSLIKFLEARFARRTPDLVERNITPWRRAIVGDLTSAFDFADPNSSRRLGLPDTDHYKPVDLVKFPDEEPVPPAQQRVPGQERGVRPARALPYALQASATASASSGSDGSLRLRFHNAGNAGGAGAVFQVRQAGVDAAPRSYTVEPGRSLTDTWAFVDGEADVSVHGPNGFFRRFAGGAGRLAALEVTPSFDARSYEVALVVANRGNRQVKVRVTDRYGSAPVNLTIRAGGSDRKRWPLDRSRGWYDLTVTVVGDDDFRHTYAGHVENGRDSISDPAMGGVI